MIPVLIILLIIIAVVMLLKKNAVIAVICVGLALLLAIIRPFFTPSSLDESNRFQEKSINVMTDVFAERVLARHPDKKITLITAPEFEGMPDSLKRKNPKQLLLQKAFEKRGAQPELMPMPFPEAVKNNLKQLQSSIASDSADSALMMAYDTQIMQFITGFNTDEINRILRELNGQTDLVIFALDISPEIIARQLLPRGEGPELVLMHVYVDDVETALESTVLDALLRYQPNPAWGLDYTWPKSHAEAFDDQFILATRENPRLQ